MRNLTFHSHLSKIPLICSLLNNINKPKRRKTMLIDQYPFSKKEFEKLVRQAMEGEEIAPFVIQRKKLFRKRLHRMRGRWLQYLERNQYKLVNDPEILLDDWRDTPCIFLGRDGDCMIYGVRPLQCRTIDSSKTCESWYQPEVRKYRFLWEGFAYILLEEEQERRGREEEGGSLINLASQMESTGRGSRHIIGGAR